jgi:hypothetical protein
MLLCSCNNFHQADLQSERGRISSITTHDHNQQQLENTSKPKLINIELSFLAFSASLYDCSILCMTTEFYIPLTIIFFHRHSTCSTIAYCILHQLHWHLTTAYPYIGFRATATGSATHHCPTYQLLRTSSFQYLYW